MPQVVLETLVKIACETLADDNKDTVHDPMIRPVTPIDFPPESYSLSKEAQLEWFNENAFFERKESQKGNSFPAQNTSSHSQKIPLKSKTSVIRLPKPQKTCFNEAKKRRDCRIARTLMIPKRFGSLLRSDPSFSEPGSPKVSCIGRVRSKRERSRRMQRDKSGRTDSFKDKPVLVKKSGFFAIFRAIFRTGGGCKSLTASGAHAPDRDKITLPGEIEKSSPTRMSAGSRKSIDGGEPVLTGLGGMMRFTSGRRPDLLGED
ncbi:unnamed protein product [Eruca vesicaria subsp. sativa]|uniref:Uncharacterized protein n=1 Tax=Eruca vesicaria subsp. sativa TaxID=29727 RepID=A0ABC8J597_ERUVS|nr:unnamed protein product [Eruca vesicaria subsp. sativa]